MVQKKGEKAATARKYSPLERLHGFAELGRPLEWSKSLLNMTLATFLAFYCFNAVISLAVFVQGFFSVAFLWSGLYTLNDYTDRFIDAKHEVKKGRPIPSGRVSPAQAMGFACVLFALSFMLAFMLDSIMLVIFLLVMVLNQILYTMHPFRLKSRKIFDFISGSMVNPVFRYFSGMALFVAPYAMLTTFQPVLPLIFVVGFQFGGYSMYRMFSKKHDLSHKMKSSVALMNEKKVKTASYIAVAAAALSYLLLILNGATIRNTQLGFLPLQYLLAVIPIIIFIAPLKNAMTNPQKANMRLSYWATYLATIVFIIGNAIIFFLFPW